MSAQYNSAHQRQIDAQSPAEHIDPEQAAYEAWGEVTPPDLLDFAKWVAAHHSESSGKGRAARAVLANIGPQA